MTSRLTLFKDTYIYYLKNYYRSRSFYLMFSMAIVVSCLLTYLSFKYLNDLNRFAQSVNFVMSGTSAKEKILGYLWSFVLSSLPAFAAVFFGSPSISSEIETKTALHVFTLPIPRIILLLGKFFSSVTVTSIIVITYTLFEAAVFQYIFNTLIIQLLYSFLLTLLFVLSFSAMTFLISSLFNRNTYAYITALIIYLLVFSAATIMIELLYSVTPYFVMSGTSAKEKILGYLWSFVLSSLPAFAAVFFGSPSISSEIETKTALHVFTLPIPRIILLLGKFFSSVTVTSIIVITYTLFEAAVFQYIFNTLIIQLLYSFLLTLLFVLSFSAMTFLISSLFNRNTYAYITALIIYLLVFSAATIMIELLYSVTPYYLLNNAASITSRVYIDIYFGISTNGSNPNPASYHLIILCSLVMFLYFIVSLGITAVIFERKEVK